MKNKLKISTICALCAVVALPAMAAPSVRTLGGAGTYAGTQSATNARGTTTVGNSSINSVRMNNRAAGARTASTPRLAIGRYLGKNASISGGAVSSVKPGQSGSVDNSELTERVDALTDRISELADKISELSGETIGVEYKNGVLIISQNGVEDSYDLTDLSDADAVADLETKVEELRAAIDALQVGQEADLQNYYTKSDADEKFATKSELPTDWVSETQLETGLGTKLSAPAANGSWMLNVTDGGAQWVSINIADEYPIQ